MSPTETEATLNAHLLAAEDERDAALARAQTAEAELEEARWELYEVALRAAEQADPLEPGSAAHEVRTLEARAEQAEIALRRAVGALEQIARATQRADALTANWMVDVAADTLASLPDPKPLAENIDRMQELTDEVKERNERVHGDQEREPE